MSNNIVLLLLLEFLILYDKIQIPFIAIYIAYIVGSLINYIVLLLLCFNTFHIHSGEH